MRNILAGIFKVLGVIVFAIFGLLGFIIELGILNQVIGYWGSVIAFVLFPITFTVAPWYALIARGNWSPLVIVCGGGILAAILFYIGSAIAPDEMQPSPDEMQLSPTSKKYVKWYRVVLIILLILAPSAISVLTMTYSSFPLRSAIELLLLIACIIGLAIKRKWGSVLAMIWSVYLILSNIWIVANSHTSGTKSLPYMAMILAIVFSLLIFKFLFAFKEYKQLGKIETKRCLGK